MTGQVIPLRRGRGPGAGVAGLTDEALSRQWLSAGVAAYRARAGDPLLARLATVQAEVDRRRLSTSLILDRWFARRIKGTHEETPP